MSDLAGPVVVLGSDADALSAACLLASAGRDITLVGPATGEPPWHDDHSFCPDVADALGLWECGLEPAGDRVQVYVADGQGAAPLPGPLAPELMARVGGFLRAQLAAPPPDLTAGASLIPLIGPALGFRRLGPKDMMTLSRVAPLCAQDWAAEWLEDPLARSAAILPGMVGTWMGPRSPMGAAMVLLYQARRHGGVVGGPAAVLSALGRRAQQLGVRRITSTEVPQIHVEGARVRRVRVGEGTDLAADTVISTLGPRKTMLEAISPAQLPDGLFDVFRKIRVRGTVARVWLELDGPLVPAGLDRGPHRTLVVRHPDQLERRWDDAKHRRAPTGPVALDVVQHAGTNRASVLVPHVAQAPDGGWSDAARATLWQQVLAALQVGFPDIRDRLRSRDLCTPSDLAERFGLEGGHLLQGELALDQLGPLRPAHGHARFGVPGVAGLFLAGAGCHPGGWTGGLGGMLAAGSVVAMRP